MAEATSSAPNNSTIVRVSERLLRAALGVLETAAPAGAAWLAERVFFTPPRPRASARIEGFLSAWQPFDVRVGTRRVAAWRLGHGPAVLLVHGWGGRGGQLGAFAAPLLERGLSVVTFDGPGHGASAGRRSSLVEMARALTVVAERSAPVHAVIAHSLGAAATALALADGLDARCVALIGAPADPRDWTRRFAERFGVSEEVIERMRARAETRLGRRWAELDVVALAPRLTVPALVVHDQDDAEVSWNEGAAVADAWPGARLLTTSGLGHRRILRDATVVQGVVEFVAEGIATGGAASVACPTCASSGGVCDICAFGTELFDRAARQRRVFPPAA